MSPVFLCTCPRQYLYNISNLKRITKCWTSGKPLLLAVLRTPSFSYKTVFNQVWFRRQPLGTPTQHASAGSSQVLAYVPSFVDQNLLIYIPFGVNININALGLRIASIGSLFSLSCTAIFFLFVFFVFKVLNLNTPPLNYHKWSNLIWIRFSQLSAMLFWMLRIFHIWDSSSSCCKTINRQSLVNSQNEPSLYASELPQHCTLNLILHHTLD